MILRGGIIAAWRDASDGRSNINGAYDGHAARDVRAMILPPATPFTLTTTGYTLHTTYYSTITLQL